VSPPEPQRVDHVALIQRRRADDHRQEGIDHRQVLKRREPVAPGHHEVKRHQLRAQLMHASRGLDPVLRLANDLVPPIAEDLPQQRTAQQVVIDDQDTRQSKAFSEACGAVISTRASSSTASKNDICSSAVGRARPSLMSARALRTLSATI